MVVNPLTAGFTTSTSRPLASCTRAASSDGKLRDSWDAPVPMVYESPKARYVSRYERDPCRLPLIGPLNGPTSRLRSLRQSGPDSRPCSPSNRLVFQMASTDHARRQKGRQVAAGLNPAAPAPSQRLIG